MRYEQYIGVDLHKAFFQACAVTGDGRRLWETRWARTAEGITAFLQQCGAPTIVAVEASTPTWHFADAVAEHVSALVVVDPVKTRLKAGFAAKTDQLDARRLADAVRRESVVSIYYPPRAIREVRELCRSRHALVQTRTALLLRLRALLLRHGISETPRQLQTARGQAWLTTLTLPPQAAASVARLSRVIGQTTRELEAVTADVVAEATGDPIVQRLQTIPGIGPTLGLLVRAEIGTM